MRIYTCCNHGSLRINCTLPPVPAVAPVIVVGLAPFFPSFPAASLAWLEREKKEGKAESHIITRCKDLVVGMCDWVGFGLAGLLHALSNVAQF